jgi:hypothetical protein
VCLLQELLAFTSATASPPSAQVCAGGHIALERVTRVEGTQKGCLSSANLSALNSSANLSSPRGSVILSPPNEEEDR